MRWHNFLAPMITFAACAAALGQMPTYHLGRTPSRKEILERDIFIDPDGKSLPPGRGTAQEGAKVYAQKCAVCHGLTGTEGRGGHQTEYEPASKLTAPRLVGASEFTIAVWGNAPSIWNKINRTMPYDQQTSLKPDEVYAVMAWLFYKNGIIKESDVMNKDTLPKVQMPKEPARRQ